MKEQGGREERHGEKALVISIGTYRRIGSFERFSSNESVHNTKSQIRLNHGSQMFADLPTWGFMLHLIHKKINSDVFRLDLAYIVMFMVVIHLSLVQNIA